MESIDYYLSNVVMPEHLPKESGVEAIINLLDSAKECIVSDMKNESTYDGFPHKRQRERERERESVIVVACSKESMFK